MCGATVSKRVCSCLTCASHHFPTHTLFFLYPTGRNYLGELDHHLDGFDHEGAHRVHMWDLKNTGALDALVHVIADPKRRVLVEGIIAEFKQRVLPKVRERARERDAFAATPMCGSTCSVLILE